MTAPSGGLVAAGKPVAPSETKPTGVSAAALKRQHALDELAYKITNNLPEDERHRIPGYAGLVVDPEGGRLSLYWKGELPAKVRNLANRSGKGLSVVTKQASCSAAEVVEAREKLAAATDAGRLPIDGTHRWHTLSVAPDGSGLELGFALEPGLAPAQATAAMCTVSTEAMKITGGVKVLASPAPAPATTSRQDDWAPWWAVPGSRRPTTPTAPRDSAFGAMVSHTC
ncbi:hypothetical protein [Streptomyces sp. NPDC097981]|uniref:hypothetical protein n=1 Tax=Streptomyces sp. NPDC097981 TaxID=3155428 RepID=UPI0033267368